MVENMDSEGTSPRITNAVSIFGQEGAGDEFPVLKAFQQYIDAEQAKARKRMFGLCAFFVALMAIVIAAFVAILVGSVNRNQMLSDRLLELALRDRGGTASPVVVNSSSRDDSLKPLLEQLASALKDRDRSARSAPAPENRLETERMRLEREKLAAERAELKAEREKARQVEVERQRRRLYPEYYAALERDRRLEEAADRAAKAIVPAPAPSAKKKGAAAKAAAAPAAKGPEGTVDFAMPIENGDGRKMRWHLPVPE